MTDVPSPTARRRTQTNALVALLKALPEQQLAEVLKGLGVEQAEANPRTPPRLCRVCGLVYPKCRARWEGDHEFEAPKPRTGGAPWQADPPTTEPPTSPTSAPSAPEV